MTVNEEKLMGFVHQAVGDFGAILTAALVAIGDKLGLYQAMAGAGSVTSTELAARTGTVERYVREWLAAQAAAGYVDYDASDGPLPPAARARHRACRRREPRMRPGRLRGHDGSDAGRRRK